MNENELLAKYASLQPGKDRTGFGALDLIHAEGSGLDALLYSYLLWPAFIEYKGMVFLRNSLDDEHDRNRVDEALSGYDGDQLKTQKSFNTVEVGSLFGARAGETDDTQDRDLAELLREMWSARLALVFGDYVFRIELVAPQSTGGTVGLVFWRER
jgi:hypothetical protein